MQLGVACAARIDCTHRGRNRFAVLLYAELAFRAEADEKYAFRRYTGDALKHERGAAFALHVTAAKY